MAPDMSCLGVKLGELWVGRVKLRPLTGGSAGFWVPFAGQGDVKGSVVGLLGDVKGSVWRPAAIPFLSVASLASLVDLRKRELDHKTRRPNPPVIQIVWQYVM